MNVFNPALSILFDITTEGQTFHNAIKTFFAKPENEEIEKSTTSVYVGCVLRHYYVLNAFALDFDNKVNDKCRLAIGLAVANALFLKRYDDKIAIDFVESVYQESNLEFNKKEFVKIINAKKDGESLISDSLDKMSFEFISHRYNIPDWIAKMWTNNFSKNITFKIARAMTKNPMQYLRVNTLQTDKEKVLAAHKDCLNETELSEDLLLYSGKTPVRRQKFVITNKCYQISAGLKEMIDKLPIDTFKPCVVYSYGYNVVPLELAVKYENKLKVENLTTPNKDMFNFKNNLSKYQAKSVRTTECTIPQFVTAISGKVPMFILLPDSSAFDRLRIDPDYFLTFDRNRLDELIDHQTSALNEACQFIEDNGYLVYAVPTINKKECQNLIINFINHHNDFVLMDEVQHLPNDATNSTLYYAILRKKGQNE